VLDGSGEGIGIRRSVRDAWARWLRFCVLPAFLLAAGCATFPPDRLTGNPAPVTVTADNNRRSTTLSVLVYNVEGLPWPIKTGRSPRLREIARQLKVMHGNGEAPDIVLLQEVFSNDAAKIAARSGYPHYVRGPEAAMKRPPTSAEAERELTRRRLKKKGEGFRPLMSSGLYILSRHEIVEARKQPFPKRECAGFDCLANKGIQHARIRLAGVPWTIDLFNTHLNSRGSTGVSEDRSLLAHRLQIEEVVRFIEANRDPATPLVFGGDFNMRNAPRRFERFSLRKPWPIVHEWCKDRMGECGVRLSWDGDEPWMDTQDLQGFADGDGIEIRPVRVEAMFDQPWRDAPLADHDGFLVTYRLTWTE
jgi:endonuclease/exonuclease/phosphatase family metal-dependent hydrolase